MTRKPWSLEQVKHFLGVVPSGYEAVDPRPRPILGFSRHRATCGRDAASYQCPGGQRDVGTGNTAWILPDAPVISPVAQAIHR